jgi:hypothetical protein
VDESDFFKDIFRNSRMEAVCKCAAILMAEDRQDLAREVLKAMKIDQAQLVGLKKMFTAG